MPSTPALSAVVPVLNEAPQIAGLLRCLAALRCSHAEAILVDGGSTDETPQRCQDGADLVLASPPGRALQMNLGAAHARSEILLFLHADTELPRNAIELISAALADSRHHWGRFDVHITGKSRWLPMVAFFMNLRSRLTGIATGDQAIFIRRSAFDAVGGFPEQPLMEDIEISRRLLRTVGRPACLRARVRTSGRRWDARGAWRTIFLMSCLRFLYWCGASPERLARLYR